MAAKVWPGMTTMEKCLAFNLDGDKFGAFSEIGAAQEVSRNFFLAGGASRTIAKSTSAYDKDVSDAIYGEEPGHRYVTRGRLEKMLTQEYELLVRRMEARGRHTRFFSFANTVAARAYGSSAECHGWVGVKAQLTGESAKPSTVVLHVRMLDRTAEEQTSAIGMVGVNLLFCMYYYQQLSPGGDSRCILDHLLDNVGRNRVEVDLCHFDGPDLGDLDDRTVGLHLVQAGLTDAVLFNGVDGHTGISSAQEVFYKKHVVVCKGRFRPVTRITVDIDQCSRRQFLEEHPEVPEKNLLSVAELSAAPGAKSTIAQSDGKLDVKDILERVDLLCSQGFTVLVSGHQYRHETRQWISRYTHGCICYAMSVFSMYESFDESKYEGLDGGIMEGMGRLFAKGVQIYVYPRADVAGREITADTALGRTVPKEFHESINIDSYLRHFYLYLLERRAIVSLRGTDRALLGMNTRNIVPEMQRGDGDWERHVPAQVAAYIKTRRLFGYSAL